MTLLVGGILLGIGVPNVMEFQRNGAMTAGANELVTAVMMARTEAVKRQAPVGWCITEDFTVATPVCVVGAYANTQFNDTRGYVVWVDDNDNFDAATGARILTDPTDGNAVIDANELVIRRTPHPGGRVLLSTSCTYASFTPTGTLRQAGASCTPAAPAAANPRIVLFCDDRGRRPSSGNLSTARIVRIDRLGRANVFQEIIDVDAWFAALLVLTPTTTCPVPP